MIIKGKPTRRQTIDAIMRGWHWTREAATHAVDVWGFWPWGKVSPDATQATRK